METAGRELLKARDDAESRRGYHGIMNDDSSNKTAAADPAATDLFLSLTPERVLDAVDRGGLRSNPVCYALNSFENRVYEVELEDRTRVVAKFYRPGRWTAAQILEEHRFLSELDTEEIPVCPVRAFPDGDTLKEAEGILYCLFDRRGGRSPDELDDTALARLGMFLGRMHNVGASRGEVDRPELTPDTYVRENVDWLADHHSLPRELETRYFDAALEIAAIADHYLEDIPRHRLHADLHLGNILFRDGLLRVYDFDDMRIGPAVQDIWLALPGRDAEALRQREILLEAYERFRLFDRKTLRLVEPLRGLRMVHYATWLARRYHDPAFQIAWPQFGTSEYWSRETDDLVEQLAYIHGEVPPDTDLGTASSRAVQPNEELLSNKDYFWDWDDD